MSAWQAIGWWERRRIAFNFCVGSVGIASCAMFLLSLWIHERITGQPANMPDPPALAFIGVAAYGVLANVCYMGGWLVELLVRWLWREDGTTFASIAFTLGLAFSVALTLLLGVGFSLAVVAAAFVQ